MLRTTGTVKKKHIGLQLELGTASSCSGCAMKQKCENNLEINNYSFMANNDIQEHDKLTLAVSNQLFFRYIGLIYLLPLLIFVVTIWFGSYCNISELKIVGLSALSLAIFFLYIKYTKILDKFHSSFTAQKTVHTTTSWSCNLFR